jgi:hypothetical protein
MNPIQQPMIHPAQLAAQLAGMNEAQDNNPHCPPSTYAIGSITGFSIAEKYNSGLSMCVEYQVLESGRPDMLPLGAMASETLNHLADKDKNKRDRQQARLKKFLSAVYGIPLDQKLPNGQPFDWVGFAVALSTSPSAPNGNAGAAITGRKFKVVTEAEKKTKDGKYDYVSKEFYQVA